jgi:hypothetical protein
MGEVTRSEGYGVNDVQESHPCTCRDESKV